MGITNGRLEALRNGNPLRDYVLNYLLKKRPHERQELLGNVLLHGAGIGQGGELTKLIVGAEESRVLGMVCFEFASFGLQQIIFEITQELDLWDPAPGTKNLPF